MKSRLQTQLEQWKTAAARYLPLNRDEQNNRLVEMDESTYEACKQIADRDRTTVHAVLSDALQHYVALRQSDTAPDAVKRSHPLLRLDGLMSRSLAELGGEPT